MSKLLWDRTGQRYYESGIDRGVLYLSDGTAVPWNGLTGVDEEFSGDTTTPYYLDGIKFNDGQTTDDFVATLKAFTYPEEFSEYQGITDVGNGLSVDGQQLKTFGLSYRTLIGNDSQGRDLGYKLHLVYNLTAVETTPTRQSLNNTPTASEFSWTITSSPEMLDGYRPTAHVIIDSRYINHYLLLDLEAALYGTDTEDAILPSLSDLVNYVEQWDIVEVQDNGDGTWTATGPDEFVVMLDDTTFLLNGVSVVWLDADTYKITTTVVET